MGGGRDDNGGSSGAVVGMVAEFVTSAEDSGTNEPRGWTETFSREYS